MIFVPASAKALARRMSPLCFTFACIFLLHHATVEVISAIQIGSTADPKSCKHKLSASYVVNMRHVLFVFSTTSLMQVVDCCVEDKARTQSDVALCLAQANGWLLAKTRRMLAGRPV